MSDAEPVTGRIFDIQRFSIHDGPGIRTTVFFKGCPLRCDWCHNPESISHSLHLSYTAGRCIGCGYCYRACAQEVHVMDPEKGHVLRRERCVVCGRCTSECYAGALEMVGRDVTVAEVLDEVLRDGAFYKTSGGGMTLSGGEPMMQFPFAEALLRAARQEDLQCAMETCGYAARDKLARVRPLVDLFLFDVKETDDARHKEYTGVSNEGILRNLSMLHDAGASILLRLPIIPGLNDRDDHFESVARLVRSLPRLIGVEVMPYHRLGVGKGERMGLNTDRTLEAEAPDQDATAHWVHLLRDRKITVVNEI